MKIPFWLTTLTLNAAIYSYHMYYTKIEIYMYSS